jgi:hypothetical protein
MKQLNEYATALGLLYDRTPKAVFAAAAVSYYINSGDEPKKPPQK